MSRNETPECIRQDNCDDCEGQGVVRFCPSDPDKCGGCETAPCPRGCAGCEEER